MRKVGIICLVAASGLLFAAAASATPPAGPPGQGDCNHGNSQQTCVPDPQPTHGQDCEEHGNEGGVNEDHCLTTTTSTETVTTSPPSETTEPSTTTTPATDPSTTTTVTDPPVTTTTSVTEAPPTTSVAPTSTTTTEAPSSTPTQTGPSTTNAPTNGRLSKPGKLAFTGAEDVVPLGVTALLLLVLGTSALWIGSRKRKD